MRFRVTPSEKQIILQHTQSSGLRDYGDYIRQLALMGYVFRTEVENSKLLHAKSINIKKVEDEVGGEQKLRKHGTG